MSDDIAIIISFAALGVSIYGYYRSRYWANRSAAAAAKAEKYGERIRELHDLENIRIIKNSGLTRKDRA